MPPGSGPRAPRQGLRSPSSTDGPGGSPAGWRGALRGNARKRGTHRPRSREAQGKACGRHRDRERHAREQTWALPARAAAWSPKTLPRQQGSRLGRRRERLSERGHEYRQREQRRAVASLASHSRGITPAGVLKRDLRCPLTATPHCFPLPTYNFQNHTHEQVRGPRQGQARLAHQLPPPPRDSLQGFCLWP